MDNFEDCFIHYLCYRLYRIISDYSFCRKESQLDWERLAVWRILTGGQNKGRSMVRCTCKVYKVSCYSFSWCLQ